MLWGVSEGGNQNNNRVPVYTYITSNQPKKKATRALTGEALVEVVVEEPLRVPAHPVLVRAHLPYVCVNVCVYVVDSLVRWLVGWGWSVGWLAG